MFHYKDGLFFGRNEDGSVKIRKMRDATGSAALVAEMDIDVDGWASIVAFVSAEGDNAVAWNAVREFHMEGILRAPMVHQELTGITPPNALVEQIEKLSNFILNEVPDEPSENEGAVDTAIRLIRRYLPPVGAEGEAPAGISLVESPTPPSREMLAEKVYRLLSEVSMCWDPRPTGVFDSEAAAMAGASLVDFILGPAPVPLNAEEEQPMAGASLPPGAELGQPPEAPPEQPTEGKGEGKPPEGA